MEYQSYWSHSYRRPHCISLYTLWHRTTQVFTVYYFCASRNKREQTSLPLISLTCCIPFNKIIKYWQNSSLLVVFSSASQIQPLSNLFRKIAEEQRHLYTLVSGSVCAFGKQVSTCTLCFCSLASMEACLCGC